MIKLDDNTPSLLVTGTFLKPKKHLLAVGPIPITKGKTKELHDALESMSKVSPTFVDQFGLELNAFLIQQSQNWKDVMKVN